MKVYFTIETDNVGEFEGKLIEGDLQEMKQVASQWDKKADGYSYDTDDNEDHYVCVELYEGSDSDWADLYNFVEDL